MIKLKSLFRINFLLIIFFIYFSGGILMLLLGIPNTLYTLAITFLILATFIICGQYIKSILTPMSFNIAMVATIFLLSILISSILNKTNAIKVLFYLGFLVIPVSCFSFMNNFRICRYLNEKWVFQIVLFIGLIQLPVVILQRLFGKHLLFLNMSGQTLDPVDFISGTFFLKSDHSLGFFLIFLIYLLSKKAKESRIYYFYVLPLVLTVFLSESTISKILLAVLIMIFVLIQYLRLFKLIKFKWVLILSTVIIVLTTFSFLIEAEFMAHRFGGDFWHHFSTERSIRFFERGDAKREQILMVILNHLPLSIIGDGPYSYFNIISGEFANTGHFSQLIWFYFDLGILGVLTGYALIFLMLKSYKFPLFETILYFGLFCVFSFYNNNFYDLPLMFSLFLFLNRLKQISFNESLSTYSVS